MKKSGIRKVIAVGACGALMCGAIFTGCAANTSSSSTTSTSSSASQSSEGKSFTVEITDTSCKVSGNTAKSGTLTFTVSNKGTAVNEFEILAEDKLQIVVERENITPGTTVEVTAVLEPGTYYTASKTNMVGALVDATKFVVEDSGEVIQVSADEQELRDEAVTNYTAYIKDQAGQLVTATDEFCEAYLSGDTATAKKLYPTARQYYERIEPTAEAFGDIDPNLDLREADCAEEGVSADEWTGWHAIEKDLFADGNYSDEKKQSLVDALKKDTQSLYDLVYSSDFEVSLDDISNGAISLMEEVATSKITGEEEIFSGTDLYDFQANVEGAKVAYGNVKSLLKMKDESQVSKLDAAFETVEKNLAQYGSIDAGYVNYSELTEAQVKSLSDDVDALRAALANLTATILK